MSRRDAPLYIRAHDWARDVVSRTADARPTSTASRLAEEAHVLLCAVSLALAFVDGRAAHQQAADEPVTRAKVLLRLARDVGVVDPASADRLGLELVEIGRMIGGWRRRKAGPPAGGGGPSPAAGASTEVERGTTTR